MEDAVEMLDENPHRVRMCTDPSQPAFHISGNQILHISTVYVLQTDEILQDARHHLQEDSSCYSPQTRLAAIFGVIVDGATPHAAQVTQIQSCCHEMQVAILTDSTTTGDVPVSMHSCAETLRFERNLVIRKFFDESDGTMTSEKHFLKKTYAGMREEMILSDAALTSALNTAAPD